MVLPFQPVILQCSCLQFVALLRLTYFAFSVNPASYARLLEPDAILWHPPPIGSDGKKIIFLMYPFFFTGLLLQDGTG